MIDKPILYLKQLIAPTRWQTSRGVGPWPEASEGGKGPWPPSKTSPLFCRWQVAAQGDEVPCPKPWDTGT